MIEHYNIQVKGIVQGVFFRKHTQITAKYLGIVGWVKNEKDGSVLINAQGDSSAMESFVKWCHRGPENALVESVNVQKIQEEGQYEDFEILR